MAIDDLTIWKTTLAALPKVGDSSWAANFALWVDERVTAKMSLPGIGGPGFTFTFNKSVFQSALESLAPAGDQATAIAAFADAWESATTASVAITLVGSYIEPATPATTWSIVASTVIDPPSIVIGKAKINELATAPAVSDPNDSEFPVKFREAFLSLTITTTGTNSVSPPAGPNPLTDAARSVA